MSERRKKKGTAASKKEKEQEREREKKDKVVIQADAVMQETEEAGEAEEKISGSGKFVFPANQATYDGEWHRFDGVVKRHGFGRYTESDQSYDGEWKEDKMHGRGVFRYQDGSVYDGEWVQGEYQGIGQYTMPDGSSYEGEWRANKMHGNGVVTDKSGEVWKGFFNYGSGPGLRNWRRA